MFPAAGEEKIERQHRGYGGDKRFDQPPTRGDAQHAQQVSESRGGGVHLDHAVANERGGSDERQSEHQMKQLEIDARRQVKQF